MQEGAKPLKTLAKPIGFLRISVISDQGIQQPERFSRKFLDDVEGKIEFAKPKAQISESLPRRIDKSREPSNGIRELLSSFDRNLSELSRNRIAPIRAIG